MTQKKCPNCKGNISKVIITTTDGNSFVIPSNEYLHIDAETTERILRSGLLNIAAVANKAGISPQLLANKLNEKCLNKLTDTDIEKIMKIFVNKFVSV